MAKGIHRYGQAGDAEGGQALYIGIVQRHLAGLVGVFIVHIMDDIDGVRIQPATYSSTL